MKFYLDNTDDIFLYQLLKAASVFEEYAHIRRVIQDGQIKVNKQTVFKQRTKLFPGDEVEYKDIHVKIVAGNEPLKEKPVRKEPEKVVHGKIAKWQSKPLRKEENLQEKLDEAISRLHNLFRGKKISLSLAESCTGGMAGQYITGQAGASEYFMGGVVSYSNEAKEKILHVKKSALEKHGAVSEAVANSMADGVSRLFKSRFSGAITGLAGPDGGSRDKPVGTVYISVKHGDTITAKHFKFKGNRNKIRQQSCLELFLLLRELAGETK